MGFYVACMEHIITYIQTRPRLVDAGPRPPRQPTHTRTHIQNRARAHAQAAHAHNATMSPRGGGSHGGGSGGSDDGSGGPSDNWSQSLKLPGSHFKKPAPVAALAILCLSILGLVGVAAWSYMVKPNGRKVFRWFGLPMAITAAIM
jgi:hypothetical protein